MHACTPASLCPPPTSPTLATPPPHPPPVLAQVNPADHMRVGELKLRELPRLAADTPMYDMLKVGMGQPASQADSQADIQTGSTLALVLAGAGAGAGLLPHVHGRPAVHGGCEAGRREAQGTCPPAPPPAPARRHRVTCASPGRP